MASSWHPSPVARGRSRRQEQTSTGSPHLSRLRRPYVAQYNTCPAAPSGHVLRPQVCVSAVLKVMFKNCVC